MGMFDEVIWEGAPEEDKKDGPYQTKDFNCELDTYTITKDGELFHYGKKCAYFSGQFNFYPPDYTAVVIKGNVVEIKDDHGNVVESHPLTPVVCPHCGREIKQGT